MPIYLPPSYNTKRPVRPEPQPYPGDPAPPGIQNRAISIRQPYVEAILQGIKKVEYRSVPTRIRGRVYLYASLKPAEMDHYEEQEYYEELGLKPGTPLPTGLLLGTVEIMACAGMPGDYEWHLAKPERLEQPIKPENHPQPVWFQPFRKEKA